MRQTEQLLSKRTKVILTVFFLSFIVLSKAQSFDNVEIIGNTSRVWKRVQALKIDHEGNRFITGNYVNSLKIGDTTLTGHNIYESYYIAKFNENHELEWVRKFTCIGNVIITQLDVDKDGNLYAGGRFFNDIVIHHGKQKTKISKKTPAFDYLIAKFNSNGQLISTYSPSHRFDTDEIKDFAIDKDNKVYSLSYTNFRYRISRLPINGYTYLVDSFKEFGGASFGKISIDHMGNIILSGDLNDVTYLHSNYKKTWQPTGILDGFVLSLRDAGGAFKVNNYLQIETNDSSAVRINDVSLVDNDLYLCGPLFGTIAMGDSSYTNPNLGGDKSFFAKYTFDISKNKYELKFSNVIRNSHKSEAFKCLANSSGEMYLIGQFSDTFQIDGNILVPKNHTAYLTKVDPKGRQMFTRALNPKFWTGFTNIEFDKCEKLVVAGGIAGDQIVGKDTFSFQGGKGFFANFYDLQPAFDFIFKERFLCPNDTPNIVIKTSGMNPCNTNNYYISDKTGNLKNRKELEYNQLYDDSISISLGSGLDIGKYFIQVESTQPKSIFTSILPFYVINSPNSIQKIFGDTITEIGKSYTYSVDSTSFNSYNWEVENGILKSGQGSSKVKIKWDSIGNNKLTVFAYINDNCNGPLSKLTIATDDNSSLLLAEYKISVYPNPVKDILIIENASFNGGSLCLYDFNGKLLIKETKLNNENIHLDLRELQKGLYILEIKKDDETTHQKIQKL